MPSILVVEQEDRYVERINGALSAEGWRVRVVPRADQAIQAAASEAPDLVLVSAEIPGAESLASSFSRSAGGPGVLGLLPEKGAGAIEADDLLAKPFTDEQLRSAARRALGVRRAPVSQVAVAAKTEHKLTSHDIFGDVLAEVESDLSRSGAPAPTPPRPVAAPARPPGPAAEDDVQRRLEKTLSGVLGVEPKPRPAPTAPRRPVAAADNVDALLSKTLSNLDLGRTKTGVRAPVPAAPASPAAPQPAATAPAPVPRPAPPPAPVPPAAAAPPAVKPPAPAPEGTAARRRVGDFDFSELEELARPMRPAAPAPPRPTAPAPAAVAPARPAPPPRPAPASAPPAVTQVPVPPPQPRGVSLALDPAATQRIPIFLDEPGEQAGESFGQYTLLDRIAVGGMAEVWKARMRGVEGFQKTVAIKRILPHMTDNAEFVGMFIDEAKLAAQLTHPNIVHIYDLGKIGRDYYIAMEYVEGKDLRSLLNAGRRKGLPLPLELGLLIAARLASALDYAHRKRDFEDREMGLVHRDVSPQNVLLTYDGDVKLCDFGIAKAVSKVGQTQMGALKGKLQYMSPEQAWGRAVDSRSDLFSLGAVLFEMVTGERLFPGDSEISVLEAVRQGKTRSPRQVDPAVPREVDEIVVKALAVDPQDRFQSADEMKRRLGAAIASLAPSVGPTDLAAYLQRVFEPGDTEPIQAETAPAPVSASRAAPPPPAPVAPLPAEPAEPVEAVAPLVDVAVEEEGGRKSRTLLYAAIAALIVVAVVTFFLLNRRREAAPAPPPNGASSTGTPVQTAPPAPPPAAVPAAGEVGTQQPSETPAAPTAAMPADLQALVDKQLAAKEEELRRKNEEKLKELEKQLAANKTAPSQPAPAAQAPPPEPTPAPAAVETTPSAPAPEPQREPEQAPPPPAAPEPPRVQVGDLAVPGAGVVPPQLVTFPKPEYPPMARNLRVEGVVVVSVLVDENGQVQDVRMAEPIAKKVGLNEAAIAAARSARYKPATKDGVRVKMWTRLKIPFKL
ncbi:MAG TPA: TonB family protein [Thermoanaerobaculia bacterium]|jgi:TonB family protein|nr:TonB family protein [Thermoanaerobaculia bacterium]